MVDFKALSAPFDPSVISWRVGSVTKDKTKGMALAYLDARAVMDRLDAVCGPAGWQCKYSHANGKTVCDIGIMCLGEGEYAHANPQWVWKADGAGDSDIEAEKGALSDAFKRAAVRWGIGRYLYEVDSPWVELDEWKRIKQGEYKRLDQALRQHTQKILNPPPAVVAAASKSIAEARDEAARRANETPAPPKRTAKAWTDDAIIEIMKLNSSQEIDKWWEKHKADITNLGGVAPAHYDRLVDAAENRRNTILENAQAA